MNRQGVRVAILAAVGMVAVAAAPLNIIFGENGRIRIAGVTDTGFFSDDPGPGGQSNILTYDLPFAGVPGDVAVVNDACGCVADILRFNGNGTLLVYSSDIFGPPSLADTPFPPQDIYPNLNIVDEVEIGRFDVAIYTPGRGDPGFSRFIPRYVLVAPQEVPEPGSIAMLGGGLGGFWYLRLRRGRAARVIKESTGHPSSAGRAADS